jgi:RNA-dependent RNA polymerase
MSGTFYRPKNALPRDPRAFSVEWDQDLRQDSLAWLFFEYEHKLLRVRVRIIPIELSGSPP